METTIKQIKKRDGKILEFNQEKVTNAIFKAAQSVGGQDKETAQKLSDLVMKKLEEKYDGQITPSVEDIQDMVELVLIEEGHAKTAKTFILYRQKRREERDRKSLILGIDTPIKTKLTENALKVLAERYLKKNLDGNLIETPEELFWRVADNVASAEVNYGKTPEEIKQFSQTYFDMMNDLEFLPNSPTLMNAGNVLQQLSACFVLPIEDSMEGIFESLKNAALIHKSGGGTGFSFSRLRPQNDIVASTKGVSSGPISFMKVYDAATEAIKQGGKRRGANMGMLRVDHPDILHFIRCKEKQDQLNNFNISVAVTTAFMKAVETDSEYNLLSPKTKEIVGTLPAKEVFDLIVMMAWTNGEPGIVFIDEINKHNPTPHIGEMVSTNPCGEQPLLPYEACNLGSLNLSLMVKDNDVDWDKLKQTTYKATRFLDSVIDVCRYPLPEIDQMVKANRKIGLGVMGWADMLMQLGISYNSEEGVVLGEKVMKFINDESKRYSQELAREKGEFPNFFGSVFDQAGEPKIRNATRTTIAPTGTLSMIADASGGVEPLFSICYMKRVMDGQELLYANPAFIRLAKEKGFYSDKLMKDIANLESLKHVEQIPEEWRKVCVVAHDIQPEWHVRMQAAFQKHTDNAVSKTVNFSNKATTREVEEVYTLAHKLGCKGVTIYRDGSRDFQVLNVKTVKEEKKDVKEPAAQETKEESPTKGVCPECSAKMIFKEGCATCSSCSYSYCS